MNKKLKLICSVFFLFTLGTNSFAQKDPFVITEPVLLNVGEESVTVDEFWKVYSKNNVTAKAIDPKTVDEYLELFINFKLKVKEAETLGYDTISSLQKELAGYRRQLAQPYLTDQKVTDQLVEEAANRLLEEVNALHLLIKIEPDASPEDSMKMFRKMKSMKARLKTQRDFERMIRSFTNDSDEGTIGEDLGYFSAFDMVYPFETAAYNTKKGEVSDPVRTRFGYHIIYVKDRRAARGQIRTAHIMVRNKPDASAEELKNSEKKAIEIFDKLKAGESFETLAEQFSDDKGTAKKGGLLPWFGTGKMVQSFEDAAFALENDGDFSRPIQTNYGWHIIKRIEKKEAGDENVDVKNLKRRVERDRRGVKSKESFLERVKTAYSFSENRASLTPFKKLIDQDYFDRKWKATEKVVGLTNVLFSLEDTKLIPEKKVFTQADFAAFLEENKKFQRRPANPIETIVNDSYRSWVEKELTDFEDARLELKYPDFGSLMKEYRDGILLFELMNDKVWNKAVEDTAGLLQFYERNKESYMWPDRLKASVFTCKNEDLAKKTVKLAKKALKKGTSDEAILTELNADSQLNVSVKSGTFKVGDYPKLDSLDRKTGVSNPIKNGDQFYVFKIEEVLDAAPKQLDEAKGLITAAYQDELEAEWIKSLREKYSFRVSPEAMKGLKRKYKQE